MAEGWKAMKRLVKAPRALRGEISVPGDKSISHRAVMLNSIALGDARVSNFAQSADCLGVNPYLNRSFQNSPFFRISSSYPS